MTTIKQPVRAYFIDGSVDGQPFALLQIEIDCAECGPQRYLIPGHHLRTVRDVIMDHLDQFPALAQGEPTTKVSTTGPILVGGGLSQKSESN